MVAVAVEEFVGPSNLDVCLLDFVDMTIRNVQQLTMNGARVYGGHFSKKQF